MDDFGRFMEVVEELSGLFGEFELGDGFGAFAEPVEFEVADHSFVVFFEADFLGDSVFVLFGHVFADEFEECGFACEEDGEDFVDEFFSVFFECLGVLVGEAVLESFDGGVEFGD